MDTFESIFKRRSVRKYKPEPVKDEDLNKILEAVRWSPSWANVQPWEVIIVKNEEMKKKLQGAMPEGNPARKAIVNAPVLIVMIGRKNLSGVYKGVFATTLGDWMMFDLGIACQNLCLAAWALGLGTVHAGLLSHDAANKVLELPNDLTVIELIPLGYPDHEPSAPPRKELKQFVSYEKFGNR